MCFAECLGRSIVPVLCAGILLVGQLSADEDPVLPAPSTATAEEAAKTERRFEFMQQALQHYEISVPGKGPAKLIETPLLRWINPQEKVVDGVLVAFTTGGRPEVLAQLALYSEKNVMQEFQTTARQQVEMSRGGRVLWHPEGELTFQKLESVPAPGTSPAIRLAQLRSIAEGFQVFDDFGWSEKVRQPLRLLRQPIYRYQDAREQVIDGALFTFVLGTDPEANVFIEACQSGQGSYWRYAFRPMTIYQIQAYRNEELLWTSPETKRFGDPNCHHYSCPYRSDPGDISLAGQMPAPAVAGKK